MKVTLVPAQIGLAGTDPILTEGVTGAFTIIVRLLLFAVADVTQIRLLVITTEILSPLTKPASVYVALFVPTFVPFLVHW